MADAVDSKSTAARHVGSSPTFGKNKSKSRRFPISPLPYRPFPPHNNTSAPQQRPQQNRFGGPRREFDGPRINMAIRVPQVRVIAPDGSNEIMDTRDAQYRARQLGLDLVEVTPNAQPPVCKIMDYGKYKYEQERKKKEERRSQKQQQVKEVKFHANTDVGDYNLKMRNIRAFLADGCKVKLTLMSRGRENAHRELGEELMKRVVEELADVAQIDQMPKTMGRTLTGMIGPKSQKGRN